MDDLFGGKAPTKARKKAKEPPEPGIKRCMDHFYARFIERWNDPVTVARWKSGQASVGELVTPLVSGGKHGTQFKRQISAWGEEAVICTINDFFATTDQQVTRSDYSYDAYFRLAQHVRLRRARIDPRTAANIDAAARASGRR